MCSAFCIISCLPPWIPLTLSTGVTHLANGNVLSASMDGKMCLWDVSRRRCVDVFGHEGSITKVVVIGHSIILYILTSLSLQVIADKNTNFALSLGYDGNLLGWNFGGSSTWNPGAVHSPACTFMGHQAAVLECESVCIVSCLCLCCCFCACVVRDD